MRAYPIAACTGASCRQGHAPCKSPKACGLVVLQGGQTIENGIAGLPIPDDMPDLGWRIFSGVLLLAIFACIAFILLALHRAGVF